MATGVEGPLVVGHDPVNVGGQEKRRDAAVVGIVPFGGNVFAFVNGQVRMGVLQLVVECIELTLVWPDLKKNEKLLQR